MNRFRRKKIFGETIELLPLIQDNKTADRALQNKNSSSRETK